MRTEADATQPFGWWGPFGSAPGEATIADLIGTRVIDLSLVDQIGELLQHGSSLTIVSGQSGAGKTTLLTALLALLPSDVQRWYVRGCYESFDFLAHAGGEPSQRSALLVNEISPHLPIYLWGTGLRRLLVGARQEHQILATAHATGAADLIAQLAGYPMRLSAQPIAALEHVLWLDAWIEADTVMRQARTLERLTVTESGGTEVTRLAERPRLASRATGADSRDHRSP